MAAAKSDLHIALHDATGDKPGVVVCEMPAGPQWCEIRTTVFAFASAITTGAVRRQAIDQPKVFDVIQSDLLC